MEIHLPAMMHSMLFAAVVLAVCALPAALSPVKTLSAPLHSADTDAAVQAVARHAQASDSDTEVRLMPHVEKKKRQHTGGHRDICCLHANILDYYLREVLTPARDERHPKLPVLRTDLARVSKDLEMHGCNVTHYHGNSNSLAFRKKLTEMGEELGINKAIGEIDILFTYLKDFCVYA